MAAVDIASVHKHFGSTHVIRGVDVAIADGEFCVLGRDEWIVENQIALGAPTDENLPRQRKERAIDQNCFTRIEHDETNFNGFVPRQPPHRGNLLPTGRDRPDLTQHQPGDLEEKDIERRDEGDSQPKQGPLDADIADRTTHREARPEWGVLSSTNVSTPPKMIESPASTGA